MIKVLNNTEIKDKFFKSDTLTFEELQDLDNIKNEMLKGEYSTFNEVFNEI